MGEAVSSNRPNESSFFSGSCSIMRRFLFPGISQHFSKGGPADKKRPVVVFLTAAWDGIDDKLRAGKAPAGTPSVMRTWLACKDAGFEVHAFVLCYDLSQGPWVSNIEGIHFHWVPIPCAWLTRWLQKKRLLGLAKPLWLLWQMKMLWRLWRARVTPDIVYCMRPTFAVLGCLWAKSLGAKVVLRQYGTWLYHFWFEQKHWLPRMSTFGELLAHRLPIDLFIMTDDGTRGDRVARWLGFPMDKYRFWLNGIEAKVPDANYDKRALRAELRWGDAPILLAVGRLASWKRTDLAIKALWRVLPEFPDARLVVVGAGRMTESLRQLARDLNVEDSIDFAGSVPQASIWKYLLACDVFISPYDVSNVSSVMLEAMSLGCCIVTRDVGGTADLLCHGDTALVLSPGEAEDIAAGVIDLLNRPDERARMSRAAQDHARRHVWSWELRMAAELNCLRAMLGDDRHRRNTGAQQGCFVPSRQAA
jgi:glycosyltransferase involved in cell wall biosynthesis